MEKKEDYTLLGSQQSKSLHEPRLGSLSLSDLLFFYIYLFCMNVVQLFSK